MLYLMHICINFGKKKGVVHRCCPPCWCTTKNLDDLRIFYAHQRGVHFLIEQPMTSVSDLAFQKISCLYNNMFFWIKVTHKVLFVWQPVATLLRWCGARCKYRTTWHASEYTQIFIPVTCHRCHVLCHRRVSFPMGAYGSPTLKWTVCSGSFSRMSLLLWYSETNRSLLGSMFLIMYHFSIPDSHNDSPILFMSPGCTALSLWSPNCDGPVIIALLWKPWQGWEVGVGCVKCDLFWTVSWIYFADILLVRTSNLD